MHGVKLSSTLLFIVVIIKCYVAQRMAEQYIIIIIIIVIIIWKYVAQSIAEQLIIIILK